MNWMMEPRGFQEIIVKGLKGGGGEGWWVAAPSCGGIINEMLKNGGNRIVEVSCYFSNLVMESKYLPEYWRQSYIVPLIKAG